MAVIYAYVAFQLLAVFVLGAVVGSFLNVVIARLPYEKSLVWPSSRCGACLRPVRSWDNVPLLSYWILRGRCRDCGTAFSLRYFGVELLTALGFVALFLAEVGFDVRHMGGATGGEWQLLWGTAPGARWCQFVLHAALLAILLAATFCDLEHQEIPLSLNVVGALIGLTGSMLFPWPWPHTTEAAVQSRTALRDAVPYAASSTDAGLPYGPMPTDDSWSYARNTPLAGVYTWPTWGPPPDWLPPGSWRLGLATGLVGMLVGSMMLRGIRFVFTKARGIEGLGLGDADLMMMTGAFLGWQPVVVAFFAAVPFAMLLGVALLFVHGDRPMPFGPALALGVMATLLGWPWLGPALQPFFFHEVLLPIVAAAAMVMLFVLALMLRLVRG